jgi:hypothetical protein
MSVQNQRPTCTGELVETSPGVGECELGEDCPVSHLKPDYFAYRDAHFKIRADWSRR